MSAQLLLSWQRLRASSKSQRQQRWFWLQTPFGLTRDPPAHSELLEPELLLTSGLWLWFTCTGSLTCPTHKSSNVRSQTCASFPPALSEPRQLPHLHVLIMTLRLLRGA